MPMTQSEENQESHIEYCPSSFLSAFNDMKTPGSIESKKRRSNSVGIKFSLNEDIVWLQKRLQDQLLVRNALEKAYYLPFSHDPMLDDSIPESAKELIKEIAALEREVSHLEQYLLSLYRRRFDEHISSLPSNDQRRKLAVDDHKGMFTFTKKSVVFEETSVICSSKTSPRNSTDHSFTECKDQLEQKELLDSSIHRTYSTLSQQSACTFMTSPTKNVTNVEDLYHSLPLSMLEQTERTSSNAVSLTKHDGSSFSYDVPETPNWISEEMIKSIAAIYCELADSSFDKHDNAPSTNTFSTSVDEFPSQGQGQRWGSNRKLQFLSSNFHIPFHVRRPKGFTGPYHSMLKIRGLCRDSEKFKEIEYMLRKFRLLVDRLGKVDPRKMKHEEKLAFWINVHNTLVMHALLVYGVPLNNIRRMSLVLKAAYNVGGSTISVDMIQNYMLGCRFPRRGQWLRLFFSSKSKQKGGDVMKAYGLRRHEPLSRFALNLGCHSDPAVRVYTSEKIFEKLETAKDEYIQSNFSFNKENKILLPRIVEYFAKDSGFNASALLKMIEDCIPESQRITIQQNWKMIDWIPLDFSFCCLLSEELA